MALTIYNFYVIIEALITSLEDRTTTIDFYFNKIINEIPNSNLSNSRGLQQDLTNSFTAGKNKMAITLDTNRNKTIKFVKELQRLVTIDYGSLTNFYTDYSISVSATFAEISEDAGYSIDPKFIGDVS